ncbi:MAG TPA: hypothetical protein VFJ52_14835 [Terriglobia bacterium]|nr:hypothetical protein [Terriglobia bacterium]
MPPSAWMMGTALALLFLTQPLSAGRGLRSTITLGNGNPGAAPPNGSSNSAQVARTVSPPRLEAASSSSLNFAGKRDPFKLPPPPAPHSTGKKDTGPESLRRHLPPGPRGLVISELKLQGIVSQQNDAERIAIVSNGVGGAYFLRKNEELYDGTVMRITPRAVYFRERVQLPRGGETFRVVVRQLNLTGEGQ